MNPRILHCPRCGAPIEEIEAAVVTCKFCGSRVELGAGSPARRPLHAPSPGAPADAGQARPLSPAGPPPAPSPFRARLSVALGLLVSVIAGWAAVQSLYAFLGNGRPHAIPSALLMGVVVISAALSGRKIAALIAAVWSGGLLATKPFLRPVFMKDGEFFSPTSETHLNYIVPGALLLATAGLVAMSLRPGGEAKPAGAKASRPVWRALRAAGLVAGAAFAVSSFAGETNQQVIDRYRPRFEGVRSSLRAIAERLPSPGGAAAEPRRAALAPPPVFDEEKPARTNTALMTPEELVNPDAKSSHDLVFSSDLDFVLAWTGPKNPMSETVLYDKAGGLVDTMERALAYRYVAVYRPKGDGFEAFVFDLKSSALVASATAEASGGYTQNRKRLAEALQKATGGAFVVR